LRSFCKLLKIFIFFSTICTINLFSQPKLFIKHNQEDYSLGKHLSILEDKGKTLSIYEAASDSMRDKYVYYGKEFLNFKFNTSALWLRFIVIDTLSIHASGLMGANKTSTWLLVRNDPIFEDIRVYYRDLNTDSNKFIEKRSGSLIPNSEKTIKINDFVAGFPVKKNVPDTVYLRLQTRSQFIISFNLLTTGDYVIRSSKRNFFHGFLFGIFILLIAYNTLLYISVKDKTYLLYVLYILSYSLGIFIYEGYYFDIIGRTFYKDYFILPVGTVTCGGVFWLLLTREFLSTKQYLPWAYKLLTYLTPIGPVLFVFIFASSTPWLITIWTLFNLVYYLVGFVVAYISLKKGVYLAKYYLLALSGMAIGILIISSSRNNFLSLPYTFWTQNASSLGILWEALVLAATVGYRFNYLRAQKEKEKVLIRNQIAADLHDEVGSNLSAIALQSRMMIKSQDLDINTKNKLEDINKITGNTTDTIRDIVWFINPFHDKSEDLLLRMKELASKMLINLNYEFNVKRNNENIFNVLPNLSVRRHTYLIFKEVLNNIVKHSEATKVSILLSADENKFEMVITDNGKGFDEKEIIYGEGLRNLKNRAEQSGGLLTINSSKSEGTIIKLEIII